MAKSMTILDRAFVFSTELLARSTPNIDQTIKRSPMEAPRTTLFFPKTFRGFRRKFKRKQGGQIDPLGISRVRKSKQLEEHHFQHDKSKILMPTETSLWEIKWTIFNFKTIKSIDDGVVLLFIFGHSMSLTPKSAGSHKRVQSLSYKHSYFGLTYIMNITCTNAVKPTSPSGLSSASELLLYFPEFQCIKPSCEEMTHADTWLIFESQVCKGSNGTWKIKNREDNVVHKSPFLLPLIYPHIGLHDFTKECM